MVMLGGALSSAAAFSAEHVAQVIKPLVDAREQARIGVVSGEVYAEPRTAGGGRQPWEFVPVLLAPYSGELVERLDAVKAGLRQSSDDYVQSHAKLRDIRAEYERALQTAGGGDLLRREVSDGQGRFHFGSVPAGRWLIVAWRGEFKDVAGRPVKPSDATAFRGNVERGGYAAVGYWRVDVKVRAGEQATVLLNDRNMWITAVTENVKTPESRQKEPRGRFR
jgi:hypothetical protein